MPFDAAVKSAMFTRCNRLCCLCLKQCGINIEAAHIIDEAAGGSNDEDNGIPLCFDCHQEIGSYNDKHPRGNKFRPQELRDRRDQVYQWVAEGRFAEQAPGEKTTPQLPNPLHVIIDLLTEYHCALRRVHESDTDEARNLSLAQWRSCHPAVWKNQSVRNENLRALSDPAKEWLSRIKCPYVNAEDFNVVEEAAFVLTGFGVSPFPMSMPKLYSTNHSSEQELWQQWNDQHDRYMALEKLILRLKELAARAGHRWAPTNP